MNPLTELSNLTMLCLDDIPLTDEQKQTLESALPNCEIIWEVFG